MVFISIIGDTDETPNVRFNLLQLDIAQNGRGAEVPCQNSTGTMEQ